MSRKTTPASDSVILAQHDEELHMPTEEELLRTAYRRPTGPEFSEPLHQYEDLLRPYSDAEMADLEALATLLTYRRRVKR